MSGERRRQRLGLELGTLRGLPFGGLFLEAGIGQE